MPAQVGEAGTVARALIQVEWERASDELQIDARRSVSTEATQSSIGAWRLCLQMRMIMLAARRAGLPEPTTQTS